MYYPGSKSLGRTAPRAESDGPEDPDINSRKFVFTDRYNGFMISDRKAGTTLDFQLLLESRMILGHFYIL